MCSEETVIAQINCLLDQIQQYDNSLYEHSMRVAYLAWEMSNVLSLSNEVQFDTYLAGILHDFGKVKIPASILLQPGELNKKEFSFVQRHSEMGSQYLENKNFLSKESLQGILQHHERVDGSGYPNGIKKVSLIGKILGVSDVFDALTNERTYKDRYSVELALRIIKKEPIIAYDKAIIHALERVVSSNYVPTISNNDLATKDRCKDKRNYGIYTKDEYCVFPARFQFKQNSDFNKRTNISSRGT